MRARSGLPHAFNLGGIHMTEKVELQSYSREKVAYDLMMLINGEEGIYPKGDAARPYYLKLYHDCYRVIAGNLPPNK